jgi:hypothetical protein
MKSLATVSVPVKSSSRVAPEEAMVTAAVSLFTVAVAPSQKGNQVVMKKTAKGRFRRTLQAIKEWGMEHRHLSMKEQQRKLNEKLRGHDGYYGVTGNIRMLSRLRYEVAKLWRKWLQRRNRGESLNWERFQGKLRVFPLISCSYHPLQNAMKPQPRGTGCVHCARPDQWGASSGLRAGRPYPGSRNSCQ